MEGEEINEWDIRNHVYIKSEVNLDLEDGEDHEHPVTYDNANIFEGTDPLELVTIKSEEEEDEPKVVKITEQIDSTRSSQNRHKCAFIGCNRTKANHPDLHVYRFPISRPDVCKQWVINCADTSLVNKPNKTLRCKIVCELHFTPDCFTSDMRIRLKPNAVPTKLVSEANDDTSEMVTQTPGNILVGRQNDVRVN